MRILGVDCGSRITGYGLIEVEHSTFSYVNCGTVRPKATFELPARLQHLHDALISVIADPLPVVKPKLVAPVRASGVPSVSVTPAASIAITQLVLTGKSLAGLIVTLVTPLAALLLAT